MPKVVHFEINVDATEKAAEFYEKVFGWKLNRWEGNPDYFMVSAGEEGEPGIDGAIQKRDEPGAGAYIIRRIYEKDRRERRKGHNSKDAYSRNRLRRIFQGCGRKQNRDFRNR
jgi:catechol 2,3-dioxygenase-like lactoylglutathione lyase family enzyme